MKKNKIMRLASVMMVMTVLSTAGIGGTFAKYTSSASGSDSINVAKWSFNAIGEEIAVTGTAPSLDFDLFETVNDTGNSADDKDLSDGLIAPGTAGSFDVKVQNTADVTAKYTIGLSETNSDNIPLQYSLDGTNWVDSVAELTMTGLTDQSLDVGSAEVTHTVYWKWAFDGDDVHADQTDATDTALGIAAQTTPPAITIEATITATQVD